MGTSSFRFLPQYHSVHRYICHLQSILFKAPQCPGCFVTRFLHGCSQTPIPSHFSIVPSVFSRLCHTRTTAQFPTSLAAQAQSWPLCSSRHWPTEDFLKQGTWISGLVPETSLLAPWATRSHLCLGVAAFSSCFRDREFLPHFPYCAALSQVGINPGAYSFSWSCPMSNSVS